MTKQIVHAPSQGLAVRSATLVARGLRDLTRTSNWLAKPLFEGQSQQVAISATGKVCAAGSAAPDLLVYDIETGRVERLTVPGSNPTAGNGTRATFAFSPTGRYIVAASTAWQPQLHIFDCEKNALLGAFGEFSALPRRLAWANTEKYFAMATADGKSPVFRLWKAEDDNAIFSGKPVSTAAASDTMERQTYEAEFGEEGAFSGYGCTMLSPDAKSLATVVEIKGDWADDSILLLSLPSLVKQDIHAARGHVSHLTWTPDSKQIVYCASSQAYRLRLGTPEAEELPFGADMCAYHPELSVCLCFSSWVKGSSQGRLFLVDMTRLTIYDEREAENIGDLCWNSDGSKAFAISHDGAAYIYEPSDS